MRIISMVAILVGVGMGSGSIAAAGGASLAGTAGMFGISGLDIQTKSCLELHGPYSVISIKRTGSRNYFEIFF